MTDFKAFERQVLQQMQAAGLQVQQEVGIDGLRIDYVGKTRDNRLVAVEVKTGTPTNMAEAARQVEQYRRALGHTPTYFVYEGLPESRPKAGLLTLRDLRDTIAEVTVPKTVRRRRGAFAVKTAAKKRAASGERRRTKSIQRTFIFAAMPFSANYDDTFLVAMRNAAKSVNAACERVDYNKFSGDIVKEIRKLIKGSIAVIADLSESRPNVLYELGIAHTLKLPSVQICSTGLDGLPFDVRNNRTLQYSQGQVYSFGRRLSRELKSLLHKK